MVNYSNIFSEYDMPKCGFKFGESAAKVIDTVGSCEVESEVKTVTKNRRNMPWKSRSKETGSGTLKMSLHMPYDLYCDCFGANPKTKYKDNVSVWGTMSMHGVFILTQLVEDEDANQKLVAYPSCVMTKGYSKKVETNGENVAEIEMEVSYNPDDNGVGMYEMILNPESDNTTLIDTWLSSFSTELVLLATE